MSISMNLRQGWQKLQRELKSSGLIALLIITLHVFFPRYAVEGHSMEPQLHEEDRLIAVNLDVMNGKLPRGSIVTLISPYDSARAVKRVIGLPDEVVTVRSGQIFIDERLLFEPYINEPPRYSGRWRLQSDEYFVLGDNRNHSMDSADYGPVNAQDIISVVKLRYWPLDQAGLFLSPDYGE